MRKDSAVGPKTPGNTELRCQCQHIPRPSQVTSLALCGVVEMKSPGWSWRVLGKLGEVGKKPHLLERKFGESTRFVCQESGVSGG
jgi:hypothetical protein